MMLPATDGARDPAGDGGATDETADMLDIALSARAPPPPAVAAGGPPAAPRPVWITAAGASAAGWPRPLPRPATAIDGGRDGGAAGGGAWASMLPRRPPSIAHNRPEPVRTRLFARPVKPRARNGGSIFGRAAHARAAAKRRGGAAECARGGVGRWTCTHAGVQTCTRTRHFLLACRPAHRASGCGHAPCALAVRTLTVLPRAGPSPAPPRSSAGTANGADGGGGAARPEVRPKQRLRALAGGLTR